MAGTLTVQNLQGPTSGANANKIIVPSSHELYAAGHVVQVVQGTLGTTASGATGTGANTFYDSGLEASITLNSLNSKVLVNYAVHASTSSYQVKSRIIRRELSLFDTPVGLGTPEGGRGVSTSTAHVYASDVTERLYQLTLLSNTYLDAPNNISPLTYKIQIAAYDTHTWYLNRSEGYQNGGSGGYDAVPLSTITLMEIAQ